MKKLYAIFIGLLMCNLVFAQGGKVFTSPPLNATTIGLNQFTFELESPVPILIDSMGTATSGATSLDIWYRIGGVQHQTGQNPVISTANGWVQAATNVSMPSSTTPIPIPHAFNLLLPANTRIGIYIGGGLRYSSQATPNTFTDNTLTIDMSPGSVFAGGTFPNVGSTDRKVCGWVKYVPSGPCTNPPFAGNTVSDINPACAGEEFTLTLDSATFGIGQTYQWQISTDSLTWTNITGATAPAYKSQQTSTHYYRCILTCTASDTSVAVKVETNVTPLSGLYTINSGMTTGGTNFESFEDFIDVVTCNGVSGPVTVEVASNSGPYNEQLKFSSIAGTSDTSWIVINGNNNAVEFTSSNANERATLAMEGTQYVKFNDLTFDASGPGTYGWVTHLIGPDTRFIEFKRCVFKTNNTSTSTFMSGFIAGGTPTSPTTAGDSPSNLTIDSCDIDGGYYGLVLNGPSANNGIGNNTVTHTSIRNFHVYGVYLRNQPNLIFENNDVHREDRTISTTFYGIYLSNASPGARFVNNRIHDDKTLDKANTGSSYPLYFINVPATQNDPLLFANNLVYNINGSGLKYGFYILGSCNFFQIYHNTFEFGNPMSTGTGVIRGIFQSSATSSFDFRNNIVQIHDGSSGEQHIYYLSTTAATVQLNNNAYSLKSQGSNVHVGFFSGNRTSMADWQAASTQNFDANSNLGDPIFIDPANGNLTPAGAVADGIGANLNTVVPNDFFGVARGVPSDAGAIEYTPLPCLPPYNVSSSVGTSNINLSWDVGTDADSVHIQWGPVGFQPGTGDSTYTTSSSYSITQYMTSLLGPNECFDIYLTAVCNGQKGVLVSGPVTYCTECDEAQIPYSDFFTKWEPDCFEFSSSGSLMWSHVPAQDLAECPFWSFNNQSANMRLRLVDVSVAAWVRWKWAHQYNASYPNDRMLVRVREEGTSVWDTIFDLSGTDFDSPNANLTTPPASKSDFVESVAILDPSYVGKVVEIEIVGISGWGPYLYIDEIHVEAVPPCVPPVNLSADSLANGLAVLSWGGFGDKYDIEWGLPGFIPGSGLGLDSVKGITTSPHTLTGLTPGLTIQVYVRDTCDLNAWHGPITITIPADHDASMISVVNPGQFACGDSAMAIELRVANNGLQPITSMPVSVIFSGDFNLVHNHTYTGNIPSGDTVNISIGNINTYTGGNVNVDVLLQLANDQNPFNDSSNGNASAIVPYEPQHYPTTNVCANLDSSFVAAMAYPGAVYGWYQSATSTSPLHLGDTMKFAVAGSVTYYLAYLNNKDSLTTTFAAGNSQGGNMFDLVVKNPVTITGFTVNPVGTSQGTIEVYHRTGSYSGFENSAAGWTLIESHTGNLTAGGYFFSLTNPLHLSGGTHAFYVTRTSGSLSYTNGTNLGSVYASNNDLDFLEGIGKSHPFGSTYSPRIWNGIIHYGAEGCSDIRVPVTITPNTDTAVAAAVFSPQPSPSLTVDFDASPSQNAHVYDWDFDDGNTHVTTNPLYTHTYANGGNFLVRLIAIDTICGSRDTVFLMFSISVNEYALLLGANLFPNPSTGIFTLTMDLPSSQSMTIRIVDMVGRQLWKRDYGHVASGAFREDFNLNRAARGVYLLEVTTTNGKFTKRVVLE